MAYLLFYFNILTKHSMIDCIDPLGPGIFSLGAQS